MTLDAASQHPDAPVFPTLVLPYKRVLLVSRDLVLSFTLDLM
jgi:hypothetical protein